MLMDIAAIAKGLVQLLFQLFQLAKDPIKRKFNPTDRDKALIAGIDAARKQEKKYSLDGGEGLFFKSAPDGLKGTQAFLNDFFQKEAVGQELTKPFTNNRPISIPILVKEFQLLAAEYEYINPVEERIEPWLTAFQKAYLAKTSNYVQLLAAKEDYLKRLARRFDRIKFSGIAVEGQEIDHREIRRTDSYFRDARCERRATISSG